MAGLLLARADEFDYFVCFLHVARIVSISRPASSIDLCAIHGLTPAASIRVLPSLEARGSGADGTGRL